MERAIAWRSKILDITSLGTSQRNAPLQRCARNFVVNKRPARVITTSFKPSNVPYSNVFSPLFKQSVRMYSTEEAVEEGDAEGEGEGEVGIETGEEGEALEEGDIEDVLEESYTPQDSAKKRRDNEEFQTLNDMRNEMLSDNAHTNDPVFSERSRNKAYELHRLNPDFWNPLRLSNLFRVSVSRMRISLWASKMEEQALEEGEELDDTVEKLLGEAFGELDFPNDIANIPQRIRYKNRRDTYYFLDDEVSRASLLKAMRTRDMVHYKESPRLPKKAVPPVRIVDDLLPEGIKPKIYQGKHDGTFVMWDISPSKDLYNRTIVVRETDGSLRTGSWQDRRYVEDFRRFLKWPFKKPFIRPDESQIDHVPEDARIPDRYRVVFDGNESLDRLLREKSQNNVDEEEEDEDFFDHEDEVQEDAEEDDGIADGPYDFEEDFYDQEDDGMDINDEVEYGDRLNNDDSKLVF